MEESAQALDSELDEALARFQQCGLEWGGGLANHGPMAAEALCALGHRVLIEGLVDVYAPRVPPLEPGEPIPPSQRADALGDPGRLCDWVATWQAELARRPWRELLAAALPALLPGLFAGATHGLLRVSHAVRALGACETPVRRRELAFGLAYWAGRYQELPGTPSASPRPGQGVARSFSRLVPVPSERRRGRLFFETVRVLDHDAGFADCIEGFDPGDADGSRGIHELCREGAIRYLENPDARVAYVHCVTAPSALRMLEPFLTEVDRGRALGFALQACLALHAVSAQAQAVAATDVERERLAGDPAEIRYRAACSLDEHSIKLAEACLREHGLAPDPVFPRAAADAALHLDAGAGRGALC